MPAALGGPDGGGGAPKLGSKPPATEGDAAGAYPAPLENGPILGGAFCEAGGGAKELPEDDGGGASNASSK